MILLSLFNGISGGMLACKRAGLKIDKHYISEIDKYANQITMKHYPDSIQLGDITEWKVWDIPKADIMIWGSPCQDLSIAKANRQGLSGERSGLFWDALAIWRIVKPKYWIMENVARMPKEAIETISFQLGVKPIKINSALVSAQNRERLYWTNIPVEQPKDKGIFLKDIILSGNVDRDKSYCLDANYFKGGNLKSCDKGRRKLVFETSEIKGKEQWRRVYSTNTKSPTLVCCTGGHQEVKITEDYKTWRKLIPIECERLQTYPDNWTFGISNTQRYKCLGNSFTVDVIEHILKNIEVQDV